LDERSNNILDEVRIKLLGKISDRTVLFERTTVAKVTVTLEDLYTLKEMREQELADVNEMIRQAEEVKTQRGR